MSSSSELPGVVLTLTALLSKITSFGVESSVLVTSAAVVRSTNLTEMSTPSFNNTNHVYTFVQPGHAYVEYRYVWPSSRDQPPQTTIYFRFRSARSSGLLLYYGFKADAAVTVWARLRRASMHVTLSTNRISANASTSSLVVGRDLNDDQWHNVSINVDLTSRQLIVGLRGMRIGRSIADVGMVKKSRENTMTAFVSLGGLAPTSSVQLRTGHFVGCIGDVMMTSHTRRLPLAQPYRSSGVLTGCTDQCHVTSPMQQLEQQQCGRCVNDYVTATCNCFAVAATSIAAKQCNQYSLSSVTLQGSDWLIYNINDPDTTSQIQWKSTSLDFKTRSSEGILFYGHQQYPLYSHLALSLSNASLHVSVVFSHPVAFSELYVSISSDLDDNKWHSVSIRTLEEQRQTVEVELDGHVERLTAEHKDDVENALTLPPTVFFGGIDISANTFGLRTQKNFVGCLRRAYFNGVNVIEFINDTAGTTASAAAADNVKVKYHGDGPALTGCHDLTLSAIQFTHSGSFARVEHSDGENLDITLSFRTVKQNCLLTYTETSATSERGYVQMSLVSGQLEVSLKRSVQQTTTSGNSVSMVIGAQLNDNRWHAVRVVLRTGYVLIEMDDLRRAEAVQFAFTLTDATYLGFGPSTDMTVAFIGCMKNIRIQNSDVNPVKIVHSQLGVGLSLGDCDLVDWCNNDTETVCYHGGLCTSLWHSPLCECSATNTGRYEGTYCQTFVDTSTVSFDNQSSFLLFRLDSTQQSLLRSNITFSFHGGILDDFSDSKAIILLAINDDNNSSLSIEIEQSERSLLHLVVRIVDNSGRIKHLKYPLTDDLICGTWTNVTLDLSTEQATVNGLCVDDNFNIGPHQSQMSDDDVIVSTDWLIYVGGAPGFHGFNGCLTSLYIDDNVFELAKAAIGVDGVQQGCRDIFSACQPANSPRSKLRDSALERIEPMTRRSSTLFSSENRLRTIIRPTYVDVSDTSLQSANDDGANYLSQVVDVNHDIKKQRSSDYLSASWIGICLLTATIVTLLVIVIMSVLWQRLRPSARRSANCGRPVMSVVRRDVASTCVADDEQQGLLLNDATSLTANASFTSTSATTTNVSNQSTTERQRQDILLTSVNDRHCDGSTLTRSSVTTSSQRPSMSQQQQQHDHQRCRWSEREHRTLSTWVDTYDDSTEVGQMEWDPQTDVGSPMLPLHHYASQ